MISKVFHYNYFLDDIETNIYSSLDCAIKNVNAKDLVSKLSTVHPPFSNHYILGSQILLCCENSVVLKLTVLWRPLGDIGTPVAPVQAFSVIFAAHLNDVNPVWFKSL